MLVVTSPARSDTLLLDNEPYQADEGIASSSNDSTSAGEDNDTIQHKRSRCLQRFQFITVEPMLFLHMLAWSGSGVIIQNYYIDTICRREYGDKPWIDCANLTANATAEAHVEQITTSYSTYRNLIEAGIPVIFSLFVGPWSDKRGSKATMVLPLIGYVISSLLLYLFSKVGTTDPRIILIASVPIALSGGVVAFMLSAFRFVATITMTENRSFRIAIAEGTWFLGVPVGLLGGAGLFKASGFHGVFLVTACLFAAALLYCAIFIKNDKPQIGENESVTHVLKDAFDFAGVKDTFLAAFRKRVGGRRARILLLLAVIYLRVFTIYGNTTVTFLFTRKVFGWDSYKYSFYTTYDGIISLVGSSLIAVIGMKLYRISDELIGLFSSISYIFGALVWTLSSFCSSNYSWMMYLGATMQMFCGLITIVARSLVSKLVSKNELGKIYSFLASGEAIIPLVSTPLYNFIYGRTVDSLPGTVYILTTTLNISIVISFIYLLFSRKESNSMHEEFHEETQQEEERNSVNG